VRLASSETDFEDATTAVGSETAALEPAAFDARTLLSSGPARRSLFGYPRGPGECIEAVRILLVLFATSSVCPVCDTLA
jgi:hypothetical protein